MFINEQINRNLAYFKIRVYVIYENKRTCAMIFIWSTLKACKNMLESVKSIHIL